MMDFFIFQDGEFLSFDFPCPVSVSPSVAKT